MKPKQHEEIFDDMFRSKIDAIIYMRHPTVILAGKIDWGHFDQEFGCKVTVATTNAAAPGGHFVLHIEALHGNPYDGHTLANAIEKIGPNGRVLSRNVRMLTRDIKDMASKVQPKSSALASSAA